MSILFAPLITTCSHINICYTQFCRSYTLHLHTTSVMSINNWTAIIYFTNQSFFFNWKVIPLHLLFPFRQSLDGSLKEHVIIVLPIFFFCFVFAFTFIRERERERAVEQPLRVLSDHTWLWHQFLHFLYTVVLTPSQTNMHQYQVFP